MKLCECGCGQPTTVITKTSAKRGRIKGQYSRFVFGHAWRPPPAEHGSRARYSRGCRCETCRSGQAASKRKYIDKARDAGRRRRKRTGSFSAPRYRYLWTSREIERILADNRPPDAVLARQMGRSEMAIRVKRHTLINGRIANPRAQELHDAAYVQFDRVVAT